PPLPIFVVCVFVCLFVGDYYDPENYIKKINEFGGVLFFFLEGWCAPVPPARPPPRAPIRRP
ncbi:MAG: hypothetical protein ABL886_13860, partial [Rhodoglobus sp.]